MSVKLDFVEAAAPVARPMIDHFIGNFLGAIAWDVRCVQNIAGDDLVLSRQFSAVPGEVRAKIMTALSTTSGGRIDTSKESSGVHQQSFEADGLTAVRITMPMPHLQTCEATMIWRSAARDLPCSGQIDRIAEMLGALIEASRKESRGIDQVQTLSMLLDTLGIACFAYNADGQLLYANALGKVILPDVPFTSVVKAMNGRVASALRRGSQRGSKTVEDKVHVMTCTLGKGERRPGFVVRLKPGDSSPQGADRMPRFGVFVPMHTGAVKPKVLALVFGLTESEARVASSLAMGNTIKESAKALGLSEWTVRTYLKSVYEKVGVARQHELVAWIADLAVPLTEDAILSD